MGRRAVVTPLFVSEVAAFFVEAGHAFGEAAVVEEGLRQAFELSVEQIVGLVDEDNGDVGYYFGRACLNQFEEKLGIVVFAAEFPHCFEFDAPFLPLSVAACFQIVFKVLRSFKGLF